MKPALFQILCEIKEKTGSFYKTVLLRLYNNKFPLFTLSELYFDIFRAITDKVSDQNVTVK